MRKLKVFNNVSLDGFFVDSNGDMSWAHRRDREWEEFTEGNASGGGELVFGRKTYEMMAGFWGSEAAGKMMPTVAAAMNRSPKVVFSRTMDRAEWNHTRLFRDDMVGNVRKLKEESGAELVIMGSGSVVSQLARAGLIDEYQIVIHPVVLGMGRTLFEGGAMKMGLKLVSSRVFGNGNVVVCYAGQSV